MKRTFGLAILGVLLAIPAHAQRGGGGAVGGGPGKVAFPALPSIPPTNFLMVEFSGTETVTSTFLPFDQGIIVGQAGLEAGRKTLAQAAMENRRAERTKAKLMIEQDGMGDVVLVRE
jgi:hypothetical protein